MAEEAVNKNLYDLETPTVVWPKYLDLHGAAVNICWNCYFSDFYVICNNNHSYMDAKLIYLTLLGVRLIRLHLLYYTALMECRNHLHSYQRRYARHGEGGCRESQVYGTICT